MLSGTSREGATIFLSFDYLFFNVKLTRHDLQVSDRTVSQSYIARVGGHLPYLKEMKACQADLQKKGALLCEGQEALDSLAECVEEGVGAFKNCKLKDDHFRIGNKHDSGKCTAFDFSLSFLPTIKPKHTFCYLR